MFEVTQVPKWPISLWQILRSGAFFENLMIKFEMNYFTNDPFSKLSISKWPNLKVPVLRNDQILKWLISKWVNFRSDLSNWWSLFFTWFLLPFLIPISYGPFVFVIRQKEIIIAYKRIYRSVGISTIFILSWIEKNDFEKLRPQIIFNSRSFVSSLPKAKANPMAQ